MHGFAPDVPRGVWLEQLTDVLRIILVLATYRRAFAATATHRRAVEQASLSEAWMSSSCRGCARTRCWTTSTWPGRSSSSPCTLFCADAPRPVPPPGAECDGAAAMEDGRGAAVARDVEKAKARAAMEAAVGAGKHRYHSSTSRIAAHRCADHGHERGER